MQIIQPDETTDKDRSLHKRDSQACCDLRKSIPLSNALKTMEATLTGRKRFQTSERKSMRIVEKDEMGRIKINPLTHWSPQKIQDYFATHTLPRHPLVEQNYPSIGCAPCTSPVSAKEDPRAGRWRGEMREECGIHFCQDGTIKRQAS